MSEPMGTSDTGFDAVSSTEIELPAMATSGEQEEAEAVVIDDYNSSDDEEDEDDNAAEIDEANAFKRRSSTSQQVRQIGADLYRGDFWKLSFDIANMYSFWIFVSMLIISEPLLVSWNPYQHSWVQPTASAILGASSLCLLIQAAGKAYALLQDDEELRKQKVKISNSENNKEMKKIDSDEVDIKDKINITFRKVILSGSFVLELGCILLGWVCLWTYPGLSTLRCFRAFRLLWFHELPKEVLTPLKSLLGKIFFLFGGLDFAELIFKVMKYATVTLSHLGQEMLCLTKKSRGGFILMFMLFYIAYVLGTTLWIETEKTALGNDFCVDILSCTYTMIRLTFFDGNGFDFAFSLIATKKHPIMFCVCIFYLCVTSFGIVNGLIGVFGDIFKDDSDRVFETNKEEEMQLQDRENEHFQRYNNTAESLILLQVEIKKLDKRMDEVQDLMKQLVSK